MDKEKRHMTNRWMTILMAVLALAMLSTTGCIKKRKPKAGQMMALDGDYTDQLEIIGYNDDGTPIYAEGSEELAGRTDDMEMGSGQFEAVYFEYDSPQLSPMEQGKIDVVVMHLQSNPTQGVVIEGHCDERGSNEYNLALGERRALAVRAAMIALGIDGERVQTRSYGEERAVAFGHEDSAWRLNRRAEFVFTQM
jgi:peptidoglycan-associated lipoprotein